ncbi:MAG: hypothetical protein WDZ47_09005 [Bacteroidales bacterium]
MRSYKAHIAVCLISLMVVSCGVDGDPGHCYFSLDWEYYSEDYGVYYYEDNNPDFPKYGESKEGYGRSNSYFSEHDSGIINSEEIVAGQYYESYPGSYNYFYESQDSMNWYQHFGFYELKHNLGTPGGLLHDGLDGADTYFELYLYVKVRKGLDHTGGLKSLQTEQPFVISHSEENPIEGIQGKLTRSGRIIHGDTLRIETMQWEQTKGDWTLRIEETMKIYKK